MKKTLITSVTAFAIILSAGTSTAGPLRDHSQRGFAQKVHSSVSQTVNHADGMADIRRHREDDPQPLLNTINIDDWTCGYGDTQRPPIIPRICPRVPPG